MKVVFKRMWFNGDRYRPDRVVDVPDEFRGVLPKDAKIVEAPEVVAVQKTHDTLRDFDEVRQAAKVEDVAMATLRKDLESGERKKK